MFRAFRRARDFFKQRAIGQPSGGVIRVAEEEHLRPRLPQKIQNAAVRRKIVLLRERIARHGAACARERERIFRKRRRELGGALRPDGVGKGVYELRRARCRRGCIPPARPPPRRWRRAARGSRGRGSGAPRAALRVMAASTLSGVPKGFVLAENSSRTFPA